MENEQRKKLEKIIAEIIFKELGELPIFISQILDFGSVNHVFDVSCPSNNFIIRLNLEENKRLEFLKEEWCINTVTELGVPGPKILANGIIDGFPYMIQEKLAGINGSKCSEKEKINIWKFLGTCASKYHKIKAIELPEVKAAEFHNSWQSKLDYNINQLDPEDSLLTNDLFNLQEHNELKQILISMKDNTYEVGLIHGDLSPRNAIKNGNTISLIDWGTAAIDIVPHNEIGIILIEGEANEAEFNAFLDGMQIDEKAYRELEIEIRKLNLLHRLDKYRWAETYDVENLERFIHKLRGTFGSWAEKIVNNQKLI